MSELRVTQYQPDCYAVVWKGLGPDEVGDHADIPISSSVRCAQIVHIPLEGAAQSLLLPAGSTISIEGSMDGENWMVLTDGFGRKLTGLTEGEITDIMQCTRFVRPVTKGGDTTLNITVAILAG